MSISVASDEIGDYSDDVLTETSRYPSPPICPKCHTRVCMTYVCNPPAPTTEEGWQEEIARCTAQKLQHEAKLEQLRAFARMEEDEFEEALASGNSVAAQSASVRCGLAWERCERILGYAQACARSEYLLKSRVWIYGIPHQKRTSA